MSIKRRKYNHKVVGTDKEYKRKIEARIRALEVAVRLIELRRRQST